MSLQVANINAVQQLI